MERFVSQHGWEIARLTFEHLWLTGCAMLLAAAVGLPLGVLLTRQERLARPVIGFANVVQTVPSLALFGLLLPVPWLRGLDGRPQEPGIELVRLYVRMSVAGHSEGCHRYPAEGRRCVHT